MFVNAAAFLSPGANRGLTPPARRKQIRDMADNEKAKLYQEIVQKADERTVLERMRLHGFWPADRPLPRLG